jgi:hypothetical protein
MRSVIVVTPGLQRADRRCGHVGDGAGGEVFLLEPLDELGDGRDVVNESDALPAAPDVAPGFLAFGQVIAAAALGDEQILRIKPDRTER